MVAGGAPGTNVAMPSARAFRGHGSLIAAITDPWPRLARAEGIATFVPGPPPATIHDLPERIATACVVPTEDLELL